jgi:uncharacterized protein YukE
VAVAESVAGIALPEGEPGAASAAGSQLVGVAGAFGRTGGTAAQAMSVIVSWRGLASISFRNRCVDYSGAADAAQEACHDAAVAVRRYADRLEQARERVRKLQREGERCVDRIQAAERRAADAANREAEARDRLFSASLTSLTDGGSALANIVTAQNDLQAAAGEREAAEREAALAREELDRLREKAEEEREDVRDAGRQAAGQVSAAAGMLPTVTHPAPPAKPQVEPASGNVGDSISGFTNELSFGLIDLGGDKDSKAYKGGQVASYVPWNPASAIKSAGTGAVKLGAKGLKELGEEGAEKAAKEGVEEAAEGAARQLPAATGRMADDAAAWRAFATGGTTLLTKKIGFPKPAGTATHHVVPKGAYVSRKAKGDLHEAQATLHRFRIGPDDGPNGLYLDPAKHGKIHTNRYFQELNADLRQATSRDEALEIMERVRTKIQDGTYPH